MNPGARIKNGIITDRYAAQKLILPMVEIKMLYCNGISSCITRKSYPNRSITPITRTASVPQYRYAHISPLPE